MQLAGDFQLTFSYQLNTFQKFKDYIIFGIGLMICFESPNNGLFKIDYSIKSYRIRILYNMYFLNTPAS